MGPDASNSDLGIATLSLGDCEDVRASGYRSLRFPPALETRYLRDKESERLRLIRNGIALLGVVNCDLLLTDWFMVPDQMQAALVLRLLVTLPLLASTFFFLKRMAPAARESVALISGLVVSGISCHLSVVSQDPLAPAYLVSLFAIILFNGGVMRMRFWMAVTSNNLVLAMFLGGACLVSNPPLDILLSSAVVVLSIAVFALFSSYRSEHEDRANWLLTKKQDLLQKEVTHVNQQLDRLSRFDPLTELANRRHFDEFLWRVWSRAQHDGQDVALLMIDIDHFKRYNDSHGHAQGDVCLQSVATALSAHLRQPEDLIARYGGEEFVAVLPGANPGRAMDAGERMRKAVLDLHLPHESSPGLKQITLSVGVACMRANGAQAHPQSLLASADAALYKAKASGRNAVVQLDPQEVAAHLQSDTAVKAATVTPLASWSHDAMQNQLDVAREGIDRAWSPLRFPALLEEQFQRDGGTTQRRGRGDRHAGRGSLQAF